VEVDELLLETEEKMEKSLAVFTEELRMVRTSRASPALVENVKVDYYGAMTPIKQMANVTCPDPQIIVIKPFDPSSVGAIDKAIKQADIGLNPIGDKGLVRVPVPPLSEERRKQLAGQIKKMAEETKISLRNIRREANKDLDKAVKDKSAPLSEDEAEAGKKDIQNLINNYEKKATEAYEKKAAEILAV